MGNNNSAQANKSNKPDPKMTTYKANAVDPLLFYEVEHLHRHINEGKAGPYSTFHSDGMEMPYLSRNPLDTSRGASSQSQRYSMFEPRDANNDSEQCQYSILSSDNIHHIEVIVCKGNEQKYIEKYAVHNKPPSHYCGANCPICIIPSDENPSPTSNRPSDIPPYHMRGGIDRGHEYYDSDDISDFSNYNSADLFSTTTEDSDMAQMRRDLFPTGDSQYGGADNFSNSSDDTDDDDDAFQQAEIDADDTDLEAGDLDEIEIEDERQMTNRGFTVDPNSSELEQMQSRVFKIFESLTESDAYGTGSDGYDDNSTTERVRAAMDRANYMKRGSKTSRNSRYTNRQGPFDSEDRRIMNLGTEDGGSETEDFMRRSVNINSKYSY